MNCPTCNKNLFPIMNHTNSPLYCGDINHPFYNILTGKWSNPSAEEKSKTVNSSYRLL